MVVIILKELLSDNLPINQVLGEYRSTDQSLSTGTDHAQLHEVTLKYGEIGQELSIYAGPAINSTFLLPETSRFHGKPTSERIEVIQLILNLLECLQPVPGRISGFSRSTKTVVEINPLW